MIKLETQINNGDILAGTTPFAQDSIAIFDPATGPKVVQDSGLKITSGGTVIDTVAGSGTITLGSTNTSTVNIGTAASSVINIGATGSTINLIGSTAYEQVTNVQVSDKLITINKGGGASTGFGVGFEIEENSLIKGYLKTSLDRNSFELLAPNTVGIVTITPGASGFTLDDTVVKTSSTSVTDNTLVRYDATTGRLIQSTGIVVADTTNNVSGMGTLGCGTITTTTINMTDTSFILDSDEGSGYTVTIQKDGTQAAAAVLTLPKITDTLCGIASTQTLTNKTIDSDSNTITNIVDGDIKSTAAIARSKLATGTVNHVVINDGSTGAFSSEAQLAASRGGLATDASGWATGIVHVTNGTPSTFSTSLIVNGDIAASGAANIAWNKLAAGTANYPVITDASGYPTTEQYLAKTRGGTGITSTATFPSSGTINTGTGTNNKIPKFTTGASGIIGDSSVSDDGTTLATTLKAIQMGDGTTTGNRTITVDRGGTNPGIRWDETGDNWEYSNDGSTWIDFVNPSTITVPETYASKNDNYTVTDTDGYKIIGVTVVNKTITLPTAADNTNRKITIIKDVSGNGTITIKGEAAGETVDGITGTTGITLDFDKEAVTLICTGSVWKVVDWQIPKVQYTLTVTGTNWTTTRAVGIPNKTRDGAWRIEGNIVGEITGAPTSITLTVSNTTFKNTGSYYQGFACMTGSANLIAHYANPNASTLYVEHSSGGIASVYAAINLELNAKPSYVV